LKENFDDMLKNSVEKDRETAQKVCKELFSGNKKAILDLYHQHRFFISFTRKLLYKKDKVEDVLCEFWIGLLDAKAICAYQGRNNASLRVYLTGILKRRIIDENRKKEIPTTSDIPPESDDIKKERQRRLLNEALLTLGEISPRDADLVRMKCEGRTYKEMAEQELAGENPDQETMKKQEYAIRKQFTRPGTGSMAKFSLIIEQIMAGYGWESADLY